MEWGAVGRVSGFAWNSTGKAVCRCCGGISFGSALVGIGFVETIGTFLLCQAKRRHNGFLLFVIFRRERLESDAWMLRLAER